MTETTEQYRNRINQLKTEIETEPLIKEMRSDIAEGIHKTGNRQADIEVRQDTLEDDFVAVQQDASSASPSGAEVAVARAGFNNLDERLTTKEQEVTAQLEQTANKITFMTPKAYGCVADGVTDDSIKFQEMLNYCQTNNLTVDLTNSTLYIAQTITILNRISIIDRNPVRYRMSPNGVKFNIKTNGQTLFTATENIMANIQGVKITSDGKGGTCFDVGFTESLITNSYLYGFDICFDGGIVGCTHIRDSFFINIRKHFLLGMINDSFVSYNYINGNTNPLYTVSLFEITAGSFSDITHNFIDFAGVGININAVSVIGFSITCNVIDYCRIGIYLKGCIGFDISNNNLSHCDSAYTSGYSYPSNIPATSFCGVYSYFSNKYVSISNNRSAYTTTSVMIVYKAQRYITTSGNHGIVSLDRNPINVADVDDNIGVFLQEKQYETLSAMPTYRNTFLNHTFWYNNELYINIGYPNPSFKKITLTA